MITINIKITEDGSSTLYRPDIDEHYHSIHGAVQESMHVFINAGLKKCSSNSLKIMEIGFGTGLNALLTLLNADNKQIVYHAIEKYPLNNQILEAINYPKIINSGKSANYFKKIHETPWNHEYEIEPHFKLTKIKTDLLKHIFETGYDLVYFDAFAPDKQPELWDIKIFQGLINSMTNNAILTTYCAKGSVRRDMTSCGFKVERIQGPPGKREMLRAIKM
jgi:tRNA U34 5-methylaminomethyl-2-thiouridine-forming methyltransferase MnmC